MHSEGNLRGIGGGRLSPPSHSCHSEECDRADIGHVERTSSRTRTRQRSLAGTGRGTLSYSFRNSFLFLLIFLPCIASAPAVPPGWKVFENPYGSENHFLQKMVIDPSTTRLYIGAVNHLFDLYSDSMKIREQTTTGPTDDPHACKGAPEQCVGDSYCKALAVDDKTSKLIECTNLYRGKCRIRNLYNISNVVAESTDPIVSNDRNPMSTAIFIGEGPKLNDASPPMLYVATTNRDDTPAVAVRLLTKDALQSAFEQVVKSGVVPGTSISLERKYRPTYKIDYVGGFQSGDYSYFATRQGTGVAEDSVIHSKLIRVCNADKNFYSYTEVPLDCHKDDREYNLLQDIYLGKAGYDLARSLGISEGDPVVYGVFQEGYIDGQRQQVSTGHSALCVYPISHVEAIFQDNIETCHRNGTPINLDWIAPRGHCTKTRLGWSSMKCGTDVNRLVGGTRPIRKEASIAQPAKFTSVAINTTFSTTVAFIGTEEGKLIKVSIQTEKMSSVYDEIDFGEPILQDLEFSEQDHYAFVLTKTRVIKIPTSNCEELSQDCGGCLAKKDPYCGWCSLTGKCSTDSTCTKDIARLPGWLSYQAGSCPSIKSVYPNKIQVTRADYLSLTLEHMGNVTGLKCRFQFPSGLFVDVDAVDVDISPRMVKCETPPSKRIPPIEASKTHLDAEIAIVPRKGGIPIAKTGFKFYNCSAHSNCDSCTKSEFPCDWCIEHNRCMDGKVTENDCRDKHIVNGMTREGESTHRGPSYCPLIKSPHDKIFVYAGQRKRIKVKTQNVNPSYMTNFRCIFHVGPVKHDKLAIRTGDEDIECDEMQFDPYGLTGATNGTVPVNFDVVWSSKESDMPHPLHKNDTLSIEVYKCEDLATNCGLCLALASDHFECGWCSSMNKCVLPSQCRPVLGQTFLNGTALCPFPKITNFEPKKGPIGGATKIRIEGQNLGRTVKDVQSAVFVANFPCSVVEYTPSASITCVPSVSNLTTLTNGPIVVRLMPTNPSETFATISPEKFYFVKPVVRRISPTKGPIGGGTDVVLNGEELDAGAEAEVKIGGSLCELLSRNATSIQCRTGSVDLDDLNPRAMVVVEIDKAIIQRGQGLFFNYTHNPKIESTRPDRSIASGGVQVDVTGKGFSLLQRPLMILDGKEGPMCDVKNDALMICKTPKLATARVTVPTSMDPIEVVAEFDFDGTVSEKRQFSVYPDPRVHQFLETRFYREEEKSLTIRADDLKLAAEDRDVLVTVGGVVCNLTVVAMKVITCQPPDKKPRLNGTLQPEVIVKIGDASYSVGELSYDTQVLSSPALIVIVIVILIMVAMFMLLVIFYRRKTNSHQRQMKYLKHQMDTIEMKVATECKEAFAELQTSLNAYTADLPLGTPIVPFLDYKDYAARVLFPNNFHNHPVLRDLEVDSSRAAAMETGLREFHKLIMNKTFLVTWVRVMEANKYFLGKDRVYVGSLLMVVLQEKMTYCTEILKQLLRELIDKTVEKKFQPKILFRRSESVAERMLAAWFTFLMHKYLQECAGKKLYELYWGIKQQMEKGPQDALTLEARYSLSEEKLLRATFDFRELTVFVAGDAMSYSNPDIPVRVLDCDTITQVKEKCLEAKYRTVPFSERPSASDLDLEWRTGVNGRVLLQDVDSTTISEPAGWKRLNTLAHYKVANNAVMALLAKQNSLYNLVNFTHTLSLLSERSEKSTMSLKNSPTLSRPFGTASSSSQSKDNDSGCKLYHLVKPTEHGPSDQQEKMVTEIYLTRLLMMKGTLQKFINDLLESIFSTGGGTRAYALPPCIKYMFDFMDEQALEHGITDPEVVHAWKSNALPLRFWVNLIKNPHFLFDIPKPTKVEGCLSVVAQTLMDACSTQDHQLTKDSPSSKLLFAKDMYQYRDWVDGYYSEVQRMHPISEPDMSALLNEESREHRGQFHVFSALNELYKYLDQYRDPLMEALEQNEQASLSRLPGRLQDMLAVMETNRMPDYDSSTLGIGYNSNSRLMSR